jgi:hypothetical protein
VRIGIVAAALTSAVLVASATEVAAQPVTDVLTIGTVSVSSGTGQVQVPIFIQDNTGTPIGRDQGAGLRISGFAMQVVYGGPNPCIDTPASGSLRIDLTGGILASQSADVDSRPKVANTSQSWLYSSAETNGLIPFTAAPAPGDRIGAMVFNLTGCPAGPINLVITTTGAAAATLTSDSAVSETVSNGGLSVTNGAIEIVPPTGDFDGDGLADKAVFRPATGTWYVKKSNGTGDLAVQWGASGDVPVEGNYAGDTRADFAVFRPSNGIWYVRSAEGVSQPAVQWGASGDVPVPGQYGGDTRIDFAVWRPSNGTWYVQTAEGTSLPSVQWGTAGDIPVPGDYDGDGVTDIAVFRPSTGIWYVRFSGGGTAAIVWGASGDIPVAADFTGDGRTDYGIIRPSTGIWYVKSSATLTELPSVAWGASGDVPLPAQMAGDSRADNVVWRPSDGNWYVRSAEGLFPTSVPWGTFGDIPLAH